MFSQNIEKVLSALKPDEIVLDVGGWACPFNRANWVIDAEAYETRGYYEKIGMPKFQGGEKEHFSKDTWIQRDICDKEPWPFKDKFFDFAICSHTLEDIRDPLYVCSELVRVAKRGYIEVPSRIVECCRGAESDQVVGLSHHRWLVDIHENHVQFTMKYHMIHGDIRLSFPYSFVQKLLPSETISYLFWEDSFTFSETQINGLDNIYRELQDFVDIYYQYPQSVLLKRKIQRYFAKTFKGVKRRFLASLEI